MRRTRERARAVSEESCAKRHRLMLCTAVWREGKKFMLRLCWSLLNSRKYIQQIFHSTPRLFSLSRASESSFFLTHSTRRKKLFRQLTSRFSTQTFRRTAADAFVSSSNERKKIERRFFHRDFPSCSSQSSERGRQSDGSGAMVRTCDDDVAVHRCRRRRVGVDDCKQF